MFEQRIALQRTMLNRTRILENLASMCSCCETYQRPCGGCGPKHSRSAITTPKATRSHLARENRPRDSTETVSKRAAPEFSRSAPVIATIWRFSHETRPRKTTGRCQSRVLTMKAGLGACRDETVQPARIGSVYAPQMHRLRRQQKRVDVGAR